mmetsp:Transcript_29103/g.48914  ORF Transcript_29103/g.48914 Transcript_29103/m.48914 type:complete len:426 (+) Transcript_29103:64-1341(+)
MIALRVALFLAIVAASCSAWRATPMYTKPFAKVGKAAVTGILGIAIASTTTFGFSDKTVADARLNAPSAAGTRVNSDPESLLRYGLPINNKQIRDIQQSIESIKANIKTRRIPFAKIDAKNAENSLNSNQAALLKAVPANHQTMAAESLNRMKDDFGAVFTALDNELAAGAGSVQERKGLDDSFAAQDVLAKELSTFEELLVPDEFKRVIPEEYADLPVLQRRANVEFVIKKADGSKFDVDGVLFDRVTLKMVVDGFNAPLTGGNFVDLVDAGFYTGKKITRSDGFVVQTGDADPDGTVHGYVPKGASKERTVPLEISLKGDKEILYGSTSEEDSRGYAAAVLPFQSYGAMGMARGEFENDSASSQFFWLLFESDLTPAGKNMLDGRYSCFGYAVEGAEQLKDVKEGDIIESAKVTKGIENLTKK